MDLVGRGVVPISHRIPQDVVQKVGFVGHLARGPLGIHEVFPVGVAQNVEAVPPVHIKAPGLEGRRQSHLEIGLSGLAVIPGHGHAACHGFLNDDRNFQMVGGEVHHRYFRKNGRQDIRQIREEGRIDVRVKPGQGGHLFKIHQTAGRQKVDQDRRGVGVIFF